MYPDLFMGSDRVTLGLDLVLMCHHVIQLQKSLDWNTKNESCHPGGIVSLRVLHLSVTQRCSPKRYTTETSLQASSFLRIANRIAGATSELLQKSSQSYVIGR